MAGPAAGPRRITGRMAPPARPTRPPADLPRPFARPITP